MTVNELIVNIPLVSVFMADCTKTITGAYCGDLLSWVMGRAKPGDVWITVMGNINSIAVAVLADVACIILCEGAVLDENAKQKAIAQEVNVLCTSLTSFELCAKISKLI